MEIIKCLIQKNLNLKLFFKEKIVFDKTSTPTLNVSLNEEVQENEDQDENQSIFLEEYRNEKEKNQKLSRDYSDLNIDYDNMLQQHETSITKYEVQIEYLKVNFY